MCYQKKIISIIKKKKSSGCKIIFNDDSSIECSLDLVLKYKLAKDIIIDEKLIKRIINDQKIFDVKQIALNYASYKPRTSFQVKNKLKEKGFDTPQIQVAIDFLTEFNLLDDKKYAKSFIKDYLERKPCAKNKLSQELYKRGIPRNIIEYSLDNFYPEKDTLNLAKKAGEKKLRAIAYKQKDKQKKSLISFLQRQGFQWDIIKEIINYYFDDKEL